MQLNPGAAPVTDEPCWPFQVGRMPDEADHFQDRELLRTLAEASADSSTVILGQVLSGTGGVGKTQLAAHHARTLIRGGSVDLVVWVVATDRNRIVQAYAEAAHHVVPGSVHDSPDRAADRFLSWLQTTDKRWLVVLDNLDDPRHISGLWPPSTSSGTACGQALITTRRTGSPFTGKGRVFVNVNTFTPSEALVYLTRTLDDLPVRPSVRDLEGLAEDLGYLPLGLAQASAYIRDRQDSTTCASYRELLRDERLTLAQLLPEEESLPDGHAATAAVTWGISVEHANSLNPRGLAKPMMTLLSLLDPDGAPVPVLVSATARSFLDDSRDLSERDAHDALSALARLNLVTRSGQGQDAVIRVHRLVQRATREHPETAPTREAAQTTANALVEVWDKTMVSTVFGQRLRSNTSALAEFSGSWLWEPQGHLVLFIAGHTLGGAGAVIEAVAYWKGMVNRANALLGPVHPDTFITRLNLAQWLGKAGAPEAAVQGLQAVLTDQERTLSTDHPDTLTTRHELVYWRGEAGNFQSAVEGLQQLLPELERVLSANHPDTLTARHNLAYWQGQPGDPDAAIQGLQAVLTDRERILSADHPDTLTTRHELAICLGKAGAPQTAAETLQQLLTDRERILSANHPDTLTTRHNLAHWQGKAGNPDAAVQGLQAVLTDRAHILGINHPHTLDAEEALEYWSRRAAEQESPEDLVTDPRDSDSSTPSTG